MDSQVRYAPTNLERKTTENSMKYPVIFAVIALLSGCAFMDANKTHNIDYSSANELIKSEFRDREVVLIMDGLINPFDKGLAFSPWNTLNAYCTEKSEGQFFQKEPGLILGNPSGINSKVGLFSCSSNAGTWMARIKTAPWRDGSLFGFSILVEPVDAEIYELQKHEEQVRRREYVTALQQARETVRNNFINMAQVPKAVGQSVCSFNNKFGYVEQLSGDKIKLLLQGEAVNQPDGAFFTGGEFNFTYSKQVSYIWDDALNWGPCTWSSN